LSRMDDVYRGFFIPKGQIPHNRAFMLSLTLLLTLRSYQLRSYDDSECMVCRSSFHLNVYLRCFRAILHDPEPCPEPDKFKPERFLDEDGTVQDDPMLSLVFGIGKRICPGRHLVEATLFAVASSILSVFNVTMAKDENGNEIPVEVAITPGTGVIM
jgi:hypothetical protein